MEIINVITEDGLEKVKLSEIDLDGFHRLISKMSVELDLPEDAPTLLYSGSLQTLKSTPVVKNVEGVRLIRNAQLGK